MSEFVLTLLAAAAVTYILTPLVRRFAVAVGAMHAARERDVHEMPTPLLGGFAIYGGLVAAMLLASRLSGLKAVFGETNMEKGLLLAGGLVVIMGFVDDRWGMGALSKLAGQVAAGVILVWSGAEIPWIPAPGGVTFLFTSDQQIAVTILVVVVTMNAVNFIDGLDGLAAGIVGIGAVAFFAYYYTLTHRLGLVEQTAPALVSILLAGVCFGFLPHNFYPARIFMGDTGSMLIGLMLAYAPICSLALLDPNSLTDKAAYAAGTVNRYGAFIPLLVPAVILLIPYADLLMAVVRRTRAGTSVFTPDKKHLQHRLLAIGHSHRTSVLIMYLWTALFAGTVIWLSIVRTPLIVLAIVTVAAIVALLLVTMPRLRPWSRVTAADGTAHVAHRAAPIPVPAEAARAQPAVTSPTERAAWRVVPTAPDGNRAPSSGVRSSSAGGGGARGSGARGGGAPRSGIAGDGPTSNRTAGKSAGGNGATGGDAADRGVTGGGMTGTGATRRGGTGSGVSGSDAADRGVTGSGVTGSGATRRGGTGSGMTGSGATGSGGTGSGGTGSGVTGSGADSGVTGTGVTGSRGTGNRLNSGNGDPLTGVPGAGTTSGPGIPAAAVSASALPGDPPERPSAGASTRELPPWETSRPGHPPWDTLPGFPAQEPARRILPPEAARRVSPETATGGRAPADAARAAPPWDTVRGGPPWEAARAAPPWDTVRGGPRPRETPRGDPPWETVGGDPPWETVRGDPRRDAVRGGPPSEATYDGPPWESARGDEPPA